MDKNNSLDKLFYQLLGRKNPPRVDSTQIKEAFDSLTNQQQHLAITFMHLERMLKELSDGDLFSTCHCAKSLMESALLEMQDRGLDPIAIRQQADMEAPEEYRPFIKQYQEERRKKLLSLGVDGNYTIDNLRSLLNTAANDAIHAGQDPEVTKMFNEAIDSAPHLATTKLAGAMDLISEASGLDDDVLLFMSFVARMFVFYADIELDDRGQVPFQMPTE